MTAHVNGAATPLGLAELRQALLAVYAGNPRFSAAEHLLANHQAYDTDCPQALTALLHQAQAEAQRRLRVAALQARAQHEAGPLADYATQVADLRQLASYRELHPSAQHTFLALLDLSPSHQRPAVLGDVYQMVLGHRHLLPSVLN